MSEKAKTNAADLQEEPGKQEGTSAQEAPSPAEPRGAAKSVASGLLGVLFDRGRRELERAASTTRVRLDLRQLRKDREAMYQKLGREVRSLLEGGEIQHPGLQRGVERIAELDRKITQVESDMSLAGIPPEPEQDPSR